jgi:hypothetical protein
MFSCVALAPSGQLETGCASFSGAARHKFSRPRRRPEIWCSLSHCGRYQAETILPLDVRKIQIVEINVSRAPAEFNRRTVVARIFSTAELYLRLVHALAACAQEGWLQATRHCKIEHLYKRRRETPERLPPDGGRRGIRGLPYGSRKTSQLR